MASITTFQLDLFDFSMGVDVPTEKATDQKEIPATIVQINSKTAPLSHKDALSALLAKIPNAGKLPREEELELITAYKAGNARAGETLVLHHQKLVVSMARRYAHLGCPLEDLMAEANIGLCEAIQKFDPSKGNRLGTYAVWWIKQYLRKALTENCRTIRIPICQQKTVRDIHAAATRLTEVTGQYPSAEEIAEELGLDVRKVQSLHDITIPILSLQNPLGGDADRDMRTYEDILSDQTGAGESPLEALSRKNGGETLRVLIGRRLSKKEQTVLEMRYGLDAQGERTLEEVGNFLGLTRERIRQIQEHALEKLRRTLAADKAQLPTLLSILPA